MVELERFLRKGEGPEDNLNRKQEAVKTKRDKGAS